MSTSFTPSVGTSYFGATPVAAKSQLTVTSFIALLTTQLQNQDPTQPMSNSDFYSQLAQLGQLQGMQQINDNSQIQMAQNLMGKYITATTIGSTGASQTVNGEVVSMSITNGNYQVGVLDANGKTTTVDLAKVTNVQTNSDPVQLAGLIGKNVEGMANYTTGGSTTQVDAIGTVLGMSNVAGRTMINVQTSQYGIVQMDPTQLTQISS